MTSISSRGEIEPDTWVTFWSSKQRTTWAMAWVSRICDRNWLPSPSPFDAPSTKPAMSTKVIVGRQDLLRLGDFRQLVETRVGHGHDAGIGLDGAERKILGFDARFGQSVEERRLADVGQADDAAMESHGEGPQLYGQARCHLARPTAKRPGGRRGAVVDSEVWSPRLRAVSGRSRGRGSPAGGRL